MRKFKFNIFKITIKLKILNLNVLNFFLIKLIVFRKRTVKNCFFSICGLNMSANGPILEPEIYQFINLDLSWPKPLQLGIVQMFFWFYRMVQETIFIFNSDKIPNIFFCQNKKRDEKMWVLCNIGIQLGVTSSVHQYNKNNQGHKGDQGD